MVFNVIFGFLVPWILGVIFIPSKTILLIAPIASVVAFSINIIGFYQYWDVRPIFSRQQSLSAFPMDIGMYAIAGCFLVHFIIESRVNNYILILVFIIVTTAAELAAVKFKKVIYRNGWNCLCTLGSYSVAYTLVYMYFLLLKMYNIF